MSIVLRTVKGSALTYEQLDENLSQFYYSASLHNSGTRLRLHYTGSAGLSITPGYDEVVFPLTTNTLQSVTDTGNVTTNAITALSYIKSGSTSDDVLLGDGTTTSLSTIGGSTDTGSLLTTASVASNIITFTKGDSSTFAITVDTGSGNLLRVDEGNGLGYYTSGRNLTNAGNIGFQAVDLGYYDNTDILREVTISDAGDFTGTADGIYFATQNSTSGTGSGAFFELEITGEILTGIVSYEQLGTGYAVSDTIVPSFVSGVTQVSPAELTVSRVIKPGGESSGAWTIGSDNALSASAANYGGHGAAGYGNIVEGYYQNTAIGTYNKIYNGYSFVSLGYNNTANMTSTVGQGLQAGNFNQSSGYWNSAIGTRLTVNSKGHTAVGIANTIWDGGQTDTDRPAFTVGIGDASTSTGNSYGNTLSRADGLVVRFDGTFALPSYGSGSITGSATYNLAVDANGNLVEEALTNLFETGSTVSTIQTVYGTNTARASYSVVLGGNANDTTGEYSNIVGGLTNEISGEKSGISAGELNTIGSNFAFIGAGLQNTGSGDYSAIGGGIENQTLGSRSYIGGGTGNTASGYNSTVGGGASNTASGYSSTVSGGTNNTTSGYYYSTVSGGNNNTASGDSSTVSGGDNNTASGYSSTVSGGNNNTASGSRSTISGGYGNTSSGDYSAIVGGKENQTLGNGSFIGGGGNLDVKYSGNIASGLVSTIAGGGSNIASKEASTIGGGYNNQAIGYLSTIAGGSNNIATGSNSVIAGGNSNITSGSRSGVLAGSSNTTRGEDSAILTGLLNTIQDGGIRSAIIAGRDNEILASGSVILGGSNNDITANGNFSSVIAGNQITADREITAFAGSVYVTGSASVTSSSFAAVLQLARRETTPATPEEGMVINSGSAGNSDLWFYKGSVGGWVKLTPTI